MPEREIHLTAHSRKQRLDLFVLEQAQPLSRSQAQKLIRAGLVLVNGKAEKAGFRFKGGERVVIRLPAPETAAIEPEAIALDIVYEDDCLAVINKAAGMVAHPGAGNRGGTLVNALLARYPELAALLDDPETAQRLGIAHRLDRGTSGLMLAARDKATLQALMRQFQQRSVDKRYLALLEQRPQSATGLVDAPIARDPRLRKRMKVQRGGKPAQTEFALLDDDFQGDRALVRLKLLTGRSHQIRVHMAFIGCPVVGDAVYGYKKQRVKLKRQFLHAAELGFTHPRTGEWLRFESELPVGLRDLLGKLR